jgi:hypothetical protein
MKLLAIEKDNTTVNWSEEKEVLVNESYQVYELMQRDIIREVYFTEADNAVLILECNSKENAADVLATLPLVKAGLISFELMELRPYTGFDRIINKSIFT